MHIDDIDDAVAAAAFRRLVAHLQHRTDAQNVDLMGLAGFCRNCLGDWVAEAAQHQTDVTPEQLAKMQESLAKNAG